jgi:enoyl-CoA hydratase/carnithine racemase
MFYRAQMVTADQAEKIGLVDFCGNQAQLNTELDDFCQKVSQNNINAISQFKTILNEQERAQRHENAAVEAFRSITCLEDPDARRRLQEFLKSKGK